MEVYNTGGFLGRGYDQTTATTHTPNAGSPLSGVCQLVWTAVEANEANEAVVAVLGGSPADGTKFTVVDGAPTWLATPTARLVQTTHQAVASSTNTQVTGMTDDGTPIGITASADALTIITPGWYQVNWSAGTVALPAPGNIIAIVEKNGSFSRFAFSGDNNGLNQLSAGNSDLVHLVLNDVLTLIISQTNGLAETFFTAPAVCWLSAALVSADP